MAALRFLSGSQNLFLKRNPFCHQTLIGRCVWILLVLVCLVQTDSKEKENLSVLFFLDSAGRNLPQVASVRCDEKSFLSTLRVFQY